jgi:SWI/SNF-related matrix-associated actin-dependent regulator of chromatin subfamily A member 5
VTEDTIEEKILDRAMKKLHLDALVIQNGRLVDKEQKLGAGEMLNAIRYGADAIFKSDGDGQYLEADIDDILEQAERKTKALNKKFSVAKKEGLTSSMWAFGGEDYKEKEKESRSDWMAANQFVDIGKRDRKTVGTYSEADIFNDLMGTTSGTGPRKLKDITFSDFHFFDEEALRASSAVPYRLC